MKNLVLKLKDNSFIHNNFVFFFGSLVLAALNYLFYPVVSRFVSVQEFGEIQLITSVILISGVFINLLNTLIINVATNQKDTKKNGQFIAGLQHKTILLGLIFAAVTALLSPQLKSIFQFESPVPFALLAVQILVACVAAIRTGYLRSQKEFAKVSWYMIIGSILKLALAVLIGFTAFGTTGIVLAILAGTIATLIASQMSVKDVPSLKLSVPKQIKLNSDQLKNETKAVAAVGTVTLIIFLLFSVDVIAVKQIFEPETAGLYGGISTIARIILISTLSIPAVMISHLSLNNKHKKNIKVFAQSMLLTLLVGGLSTVIIASFPDQIINLAIGSEYQAMSNMLPALSITMLVVAVANVLYSFFAGIRHMPATYLALAHIVLVISLMTFNHSSIEQIITNLLITSSSLVVSGAFLFIGYVNQYKLTRRNND